MKVAKLICAGAILAVSSSAFAVITCPQPSAFHYRNGQWVAPYNWEFNQYPEGSKTDKVGNLVEVEWQSITPGGHMGNVDWCKYTWRDEKGLDQLSVTWIGDPMFLQPANMSYWEPMGGAENTGYRCHNTLRNCGFVPGRA